MDRSVLTKRDQLGRLIGKQENDLFWSYETETGMFRCDLTPGGELEELGDEPGQHDRPRHRMAQETCSFCRTVGDAPADVEGGPVVMELELRHRTADIFAEIRAMPVLDRGGKKIGIAGVTRNITRQKRLENALKKSEAVYRTLIKTSPDAIVVIDGEGDIIKSNNHASALLKESRSDLIGRNFREFIPPDRVEEMEEIAGKLRSHGSVQAQEFDLRRPDGSEFTGEISVSVLDEKELGAETYIAVVRDITKKKRAERELAKSGERYRLLIESMNEGLVIIDKNNLFAYINGSTAEILGFSFEEILGKPLDAVMDKKNSALFRNSLKEARKKKASNISCEIEVTRKTGERSELVFSPKGIFGKDGDYLGAFAVVADVTAIKKAERERNRLADEILSIFMNRLSDREKELLGYLSRGYRWPSQKREICKLMDVLPGTLDKFMARIKRKMEIDDLDTIITIAGGKLG